MFEGRNINVEIGHRLKRLMDDRHWGYTELRREIIKRAFITEISLVKIIQGKKAILPEHAIVIADVFGITVDELFRGE